jgi:hypothetical protein
MTASTSKQIQIYYMYGFQWILGTQLFKPTYMMSTRWPCRDRFEAYLSWLWTSANNPPKPQENTTGPHTCTLKRKSSSHAFCYPAKGFFWFLPDLSIEEKACWFHAENGNFAASHFQIDMRALDPRSSTRLHLRWYPVWALKTRFMRIICIYQIYWKHE